MKRAKLVPQGTLNRIYQESGEAWKRCEFPRAIELLESARRRDPANAGILLDLGRLHGLRYDYASAESCFEQALRITGQKPEILVAAGQQSRAFNHFALAERYLKRLTARPDAAPATLVQLAEI